LGVLEWTSRGNELSTIVYERIVRVWTGAGCTGRGEGGKNSHAVPEFRIATTGTVFPRREIRAHLSFYEAFDKYQRSTRVLPENEERQVAANISPFSLVDQFLQRERTSLSHQPSRLDRPTAPSKAPQAAQKNAHPITNRSSTNY
jgi:hypothetical protein